MRLSTRGIALLAVLASGAPPFMDRVAAVEVSYLYSLSDFSGTVPYNDVRLQVDRERDEVYAAAGNSVRVFNASGMEVFRFDHDPALGTIYDLAVDESGDLLLLTLEPSAPGPGPGWFITRCDYRGEPIERITITGLPPELASFRPGVMDLDADRIVLASLSHSRVVVTDRAGRFRQALDLATIAGVREADRLNDDIVGFDIDPRGNMLFTIPTQFKAFVLTPAGDLKTFGRPGAVPGSFGVAAGIVADGEGHLLVADMARGVVMVFNPDLEFVTEFGAGAAGQTGLARPTDLAEGPSGKVYVTQTRDRGVAVFRMDPGVPGQSTEH